MSEESHCPLCHDSNIQDVPQEGDTELGIWRIRCTWCGRLDLGRGFHGEDAFRHTRVRVRGIAQERRVRKGGPLTINDETLDTILLQAPRGPADAADRLLVNLSFRSSEPGVMTAIKVDREQGFAFTDAIDSFVGYLQFLQAEGLIEYYGDRFKDTQFGFRLTLPGWRRVQELRKFGGEFGFIAMAFKDNDALHGAIQDAARLAGWPATRSDEHEHSHKIDDWIMNRIEAARFIIADMTKNNAGAAFEAGYALGLGRPVIWTVNDDWFAEEPLHFDFRQYNHLRWKTGRESDLVRPLRERIIAAVGEGPRLGK